MVSGISVQKSGELQEPFFFLKFFTNEILKENSLVSDDSGVWDMTECG